MGKLESARIFRRRRQDSPRQHDRQTQCRHMTSLGTCRISSWSQQPKRGPRPAASARACCARRERRSPPAAAGAHGRRREPRQLHGSPKRAPQEGFARPVTRATPRNSVSLKWRVRVLQGRFPTVWKHRGSLIFPAKVLSWHLDVAMVPCSSRYGRRCREGPGAR